MTGGEMVYIILLFILLLKTAVSLHFLLLKKRLCSVTKSVLSREHALLLQQQSGGSPSPELVSETNQLFS